MLTAKWQAETDKLGGPAELKQQFDEERNELALAQRRIHFEHARELICGHIPRGLTISTHLFTMVTHAFARATGVVY
jgi:hypothetical protein